MGVVEDFIAEYERQFDYWEAAAQTARGILENELTSSGLRAIVTSRAKSVDRLADKLRQRGRSRPYRSTAEIGADIADLAGIRVALYFPGQMDEAERIIRSTLDVKHTKHFPSEPERPEEPERGSQPQRFSGYGARHFRVLIPAKRLSTDHARYASAVVEIQVASVLMHAWSEVEHDLVYKPLEGGLSPSEYALLDQLNGLVLAGEIALEQLQKAGDARVAAAVTPFRDHFELAEFLRTRLATLGADLTDSTLGRVDVLFDYLAEQGAATAASVATYLDSLEQDFERRPVAAQLADLMLSGDESRYNAYLRAMSTSRHPASRKFTTSLDITAEQAATLALGEFVASWVLLEALLQRLIPAEATESNRRTLSLPTQIRLLVKLGLLAPEQQAELDFMRNLRNHVLHGRATDVSPERLKEAAAWLRELTSNIEGKAGLAKPPTQ